MFLLLNLNILTVSVCAQTAETVLIWMADTFTAARWAHEQSSLPMRSDPPPSTGHAAWRVERVRERYFHGK